MLAVDNKLLQELAKTLLDAYLANRDKKEIQHLREHAVHTLQERHPELVSEGVKLAKALRNLFNAEKVQVSEHSELSSTLTILFATSYRNSQTTTLANTIADYVEMSPAQTRRQNL